MERLRLFKYPGSKNVLLDSISDAFRRSGSTILIDLFGGSGSVSMNVMSPETVYNEVDPGLVSIFRSIQAFPQKFMDLFRESLNAGIFSLPREHRKQNTMVQAMKLSDQYPEPLGTAFIDLVSRTISFGGDGSSYGTIEKSAGRYAMKTLSMLPEITSRVCRWQIENMDFEEAMKSHDSANVFFYLDPPFSSQKWYKNSMNYEDFLRLKSSLTNIKGKYLMNLDYDDKPLLDIFGDPDFKKTFPDRNQDLSIGRRPPHIYAFYSNFRTSGDI
jgi:DNA adenine methylase